MKGTTFHCSNRWRIGSFSGDIGWCFASVTHEQRGCGKWKLSVVFYYLLLNIWSWFVMGWHSCVRILMARESPFSCHAGAHHRHGSVPVGSGTAIRIFRYPRSAFFCRSFWWNGPPSHGQWHGKKLLRFLCRFSSDAWKLSWSNNATFCCFLLLLLSY